MTSEDAIRTQPKLGSIDAFELEFFPTPSTPEQGLLCAVIERAIRDMFLVNKIEANAAYHWLLLSKSTKVYSFLWCCDHLRLDSKHLRASIAKYHPPIFPYCHWPQVRNAGI